MAGCSPRRLLNVSGRTVVLAVSTLLYFSSQTAQAADCELSTDADSDSDVAYQDRGNRCEGFYRQNVTSRVNLRIVGYHANRVVIDTTDASWTVRLKTHPGDEQEKPSLKVISLRPTDYFQMDTNELSDTGEFIWETDVLASLDHPPQPRHLAAVACRPSCAGDASERKMLYPVAFGIADDAELEDVRIIMVMADVELTSLSASLVATDSDTPIFENRPVGGRFLPAKRAQRIKLEGLEDRRVTLSLVGETHSGRKAYFEVDLAATIAQE